MYRTLTHRSALCYRAMDGAVAWWYPPCTPACPWVRECPWNPKRVHMQEPPLDMPPPASPPQLFILLLSSG
jgi:hypothetical protein